MLLTGCQQAHPGGLIQADYAEPIADVLEQAGDNREQLQTVLDHYAAQGDRQKLQAARFLIAHMGPHGFGEAALFDPDGNEVPYNALHYENFEQAIKARRALDKQHKGLTLKRKRFDSDAKVIAAAYLIDNIDQAFEVWRTNPWSKQVTFDTFCNYILPYRGSNEPLGNWRGPCRAALADQLATVEDTSDIRAISKLCRWQDRKWVNFDTKCYLHPTDQSFEQMRQSKYGRCEDLSNMEMYLNRANGLPMASDYTPAWARANNNHAWTVVLDGNGQAFPRKKPMNGVAKVYRKMYAQQPGLPAFDAKPGETVPPWLRGKNYLDVTREYRAVHDVTVKLARPIPDASSYAYLCVFNSGQWRAIAAGRIDADTRSATFPDIGGNIVYYPAYFVDKQLIPAAPVHIVQMDGAVRILNEPITEAGPRISTTIRQTKDVDISPDTGKPIPAIMIEPGKTYELFYWEDTWVSLGKKQSGTTAMPFDNLPPGRLYRLEHVDGRNQERPFTVDHGKQVLW